MGEIAKREIIDAEVISIDDSARSHNIDPRVFRQFVMDGDLSHIDKPDRPALVMALCNHIGIDPIERPFMVLRDGKREVLYATRSCTSALCRERKISREIISVDEQTIAGQPVVIARARATMLSTGRYDESTGVVPVMQRDTKWDERQRKKVFLGWRMPDPDEASNLPMKAETKAKRRAVLDLVGLGITDESEIEGIKGARVAQLDMSTGEIAEVKQPLALADGKPADLGPRCAGKAQGIANGNRKRVAELAGHLDKPEARVWSRVLAAAEIGLGKYGDEPSPEQLTTDDGTAVREWLEIKLAEYRTAENGHNPEGGPTDKPVSAREWVSSQWERLCAGGYYEAVSWRGQWARWAGLSEWPDQPTAEDYAACARGLKSALDEMGADQ